MTASVAFVTPSYRLDRDRCALLSRSLEACAPSVEHWIVVDRGDLPSFRSLQSNRTNVVAKEEVLPVWVRRLDTLKIGLRSNVWLQARGMPIRGWLLQQLIKLAVAEELTADVLVHADSDVVLLRPFPTSSVIDQAGRVRLFARPDEVDETRPDHVRWHRSAEKLLGLRPAPVPMPDFISSLVPWKRTNAVEMLKHIQATTGRHWLRALAAAWDVSEYTLYGRFAQDFLGAGAGLFVSASPLCHDYYKHVPLSVPKLEALLDRVGAQEVAVSLTSKAGMRPDEYIEVLERRWAEPTEQETAGKDDQPAPCRAEHRPERAGRGVRGTTRATAKGGDWSSRRHRIRAAIDGYRITWAIAGLVALLVVLLQFASD